MNVGQNGQHYVLYSQHPYGGISDPAHTSKSYLPLDHQTSTNFLKQLHPHD